MYACVQVQTIMIGSHNYRKLSVGCDGHLLEVSLTIVSPPLITQLHGSLSPAISACPVIPGSALFYIALSISIYANVLIGAACEIS